MTSFEDSLGPLPGCAAGAMADEARQPPLLPLVLAGAVARVRGKTLVGPVDLTIAPGAPTMVLGPNGAGKTTLLRLMHGLQRLSAGRLSWNLPPEEARQRQAYVFQTPIMMRRTVIDSIAYPLRLHGTPRRKARAEAEAWARAVGLGHALDRPAGVLSGGEKQKLALARAMIRRPEILFLDEPCANLDGRATREIEVLLGRCREAGARIVMTTHDLGQARRLAGDVIFLHQGRVAEHSPAEAFFEHPRSPAAQAWLRGDLID